MILLKSTQRKIHIDRKQMVDDAQKILNILGYSDYDLGIWVTTNTTIQSYNATYRGKNKPTDILSFPFHPDLQAGDRIEPRSEDDKNLGDLIISAEYVSAVVHEYETTFDERMRVLLVHGICHLLGYDHVTDDEFIDMQKMENYILSQL